MALPATFQFAIFVNGIEYPGTRFVTGIIEPTNVVDLMKQLNGECIILCNLGDIVTLRNVSGGNITLQTIVFGTTNTASMTLHRLGDISG